jgi:hypothetical protein
LLRPGALVVSNLESRASSFATFTSAPSETLGYLDQLGVASLIPFDPRDGQPHSARRNRYHVGPVCCRKLGEQLAVFALFRRRQSSDAMQFVGELEQPLVDLVKTEFLMFAAGDEDMTDLVLRDLPLHFV